MKTKKIAPRESKYMQLAAHVRRQIESGELQPGDRLPSFSQMAAEMGVMPTTFDRTLAVLQQDGLIVREHGRGVFVAPPRQKPRYTIAQSPRLLLDDHDPYWINLFRGIYESTRRHNTEIIFPSQDLESIAGRANGMIIYGDPITDFGPVPSGFPFVSLVVPSPGAYCVATDDFAAHRELTEHLIQLGHRRIALLFNYPAGSSLVEHRVRGFRTACAAAGIACPPDVVRMRKLTSADMYESYSEAGYDAMQQWLKEDWASLGCTAVAAYNDAAAVGIIRALKEAGLRVPEDVSVVGFDGNSAFDYFHPRLTTMRVPLREVGREGANLLVRHLQGERDLPEVTKIPAKLIIGESTGPCPQGRPVVAASESLR